MISPHVKPKHDFTPATARTAHQNADILSFGVYSGAKLQGASLEMAQKLRDATFVCALNGAGLLQNFMMYTRHRIGKEQEK